MTNNSMTVIRDANVLKIVPVSKTAPYGVEKIDSIPVDAPCEVVLGGDLTTQDSRANTYGKYITEVLFENNIKNIPVYTVAYTFDGMSPKQERMELFARAAQKILPVDNKIIYGEYITKLFDVFFRPRILDSGGQKISVLDAKNNLSKIKFFVHCHGAAVIYQIAEYMAQEMAQAGFEKKEISELMQQVLVVQQSPLAPLTQQKFTTVSFLSAEDAMMNHYNKFSDYVVDNSADIYPCFLDKQKGNFFLAMQLKTDIHKEHSYEGMRQTDKSSLTADGELLFAAERNAIVRGAQHSITGGDLPSVSDLISDDFVDFDVLKKRGDNFYNSMRFDLRSQNLKRGHQK